MRFVSLISSGIDSPVATYLMSKITDEMILVHGDIRPYTDSRDIQNFQNLAEHLKNFFPKLKIYILNHGKNLEEYKSHCKSRYTCIFCKRMLLRYAEYIAIKEKADAIIMGDSLGQVASQTLQNLKVVEQSIKIPILRPLIGLDKEETIKIAKEIGTYDLSIKQSSSCKAVPKKPATKSKLDNLVNEENKIDIKKLLKSVVENSEIIEL